jgi:outer membrane receptor protein involved in Fe transport
MLKRITPLVVLLLALPMMMMAQITTSSLSGTVKSSANEPLAGATITAIHQPSGTKYATTTTSTGQFNMANMRSGGPYHIEISFVGFQTEKQDDIYLKLAEGFIMNSTLSSGDGTLQQVIVAATGRRNNILNANRTGAVTNLSRRDIEKLPSITRSINDLTRATPQSNGASIAGGNYRQNNFTIDGSDFNNSFGIGNNLPAGGSPISLDAIDEISVNITPFDVRQSGFIGGAINAVTRAGTNTFSGSVYNYFRTEKQQGGKVGKATVVRTPFEFKQYGVRVGGPIIKNKLFFFFNYETENQPKQIQPRVAATSTSGAGSYGSASNIARPTRAELDDISNYLRDTYGYETGAYDNYNTEIKRTKYLGRIDWNISQNHHLTLRYSQVEGGEPSPLSNSTTGSGIQYTTGKGRTDDNTLWFENSNYFQGANFYSAAAELNSKFGRFNNTLRGTYTYQNDSRSTGSSLFPMVDILKDGSPFTTFGYEPFSYGNLRQVKMYSFIDNVTAIFGRHNITAGIQADFSKTVNGFQRFGTGYYIYNSWNDFVTGAKPANYARTFSLLPNFEQAFPSFKFAQYGAYAQDELTVNDKFKLTFGLRLDQMRFADVKEVRTNPFILAPTFEDGLKLNTGVLPKTRILASPRIGFNYDIYGNRSLQFRGGTGIFTGRPPNVWIVGQSGDAGMLQTILALSGTANTPAGPFNPDPNANRPSTVPVAGSFVPTGASIFDPNYRFPQTWKSSLGLDTKGPWGTIFTLEAIFNKDMRTTIARNVNLVKPQPLNISGYADNRLIYPAANTAKYINMLQTTTTTSVFAPSGTGNTAFVPIYVTNGTKGYYMSLSAQLVKQFAKGFSASIAYTKTLANALYDGQGDQVANIWQNVASVNGANTPNLSYADYLVPDRVSANISYRREYFKHAATTISIFYNGGIDRRFSYLYSTDYNRDGSTNDLIYIPKDASEIAFTPFTYPNGVTYSAQEQSDLFFKYVEQDKYLKKHKGQFAERNGAQYPWRNQWDARVMQEIFAKVGKDRHTIQVSVDIFNFANLLNKNWGEFKTANAASILVPTSTLAVGQSTKPTFRLQTDRNGPATSTFRNTESIASTYFMQFGVRYLFN